MWQWYFSQDGHPHSMPSHCPQSFSSPPPQPTHPQYHNVFLGKKNIFNFSRIQNIERDVNENWLLKQIKFKWLPTISCKEPFTFKILSPTCMDFVVLNENNPTALIFSNYITENNMNKLIRRTWWDSSIFSKVKWNTHVTGRNTIIQLPIKYVQNNSTKEYNSYYLFL